MNDDNFDTDLRMVLLEGSQGGVSERLRARIASVPERARSTAVGRDRWYARIGSPAAIVAGTAVVFAVVLGAVFLRSGGAGTLPTGGASPTGGAAPTPRTTCAQLSEADCERVRAEVLGFIGPDREAVSIDISTYYICLGDPFGLASPHCPLDPHYFASAVVELSDGEWAFVNILSTADGRLQSDGRILVAPAGWKP